ncbi:hypothetical protein, partial [Fusobacterium nucleatum]|uniref:hypothetical protein n=1 Tax=Fusobacterium nucleatum TaxID=851 RepID=UPI001AD81580
ANAGMVSPFNLLSYISILSSFVNLLTKKLHLQSYVQDFGCSTETIFKDSLFFYCCKKAKKGVKFNHKVKRY